MKFSFNIENIKAFIPEDFRDKVSTSSLEKYISPFNLSHIPVIERRRLSNASKCLLSLFENINMPIIYSSDKGEINRSLNLLYTLSKDKIVSPTSFSLSVLNATPAISSIAYKNHNDIIAVSSNPSLENGLLQAYINLCDTNKNQLVISYYEGAYQEYFKEDNFSCLIALEISKGNNITMKKKQTDKTYNLANISEIEFLKHYDNKINYSIYSDYSQWIWYFND